MKKILNFIKSSYVHQFDINLSILCQLVRLFYGVLIIIHSGPQLEYTMKYYSTVNLDDRLYLWPVKWIEFVPDKFLAVLGINVGCFVAFLICMLFPEKKLSRLVAFLFYFLSLPLIFSVIDDIFHQQHTTLVASFLLIFLNLKNEQTNYSFVKNKFFLQGIHFSFLGSYFLSGLWKLREFISLIFNEGWSNIVCLERNLANEYIDGNLIKSTSFHREVLDFFKNYESFHFGELLWIGVTFFQLSTLAVAWFPPLLRPYGVMIILFHMSTSLFMNIQFITAQYAALIFLVYHPYYINVLNNKRFSVTPKKRLLPTNKDVEIL